MADSIALICRYLGIAAPSEVPLENSNPARPQCHRSYRESGLLTTAQITMVEKLTQRDRELYEHGRRLFERQVERAQRRWWMIRWPRLQA
jgi:hypothetical protein